MRYFNDLSTYLKKNVGDRVFKVSLNSGFGCPNWKSGGCSFCQPSSYSPLMTANEVDIHTQMFEGITYLKKRHNAKNFIAHFQAGTSTNAEVEVIKKQLDTALSFENVVGIAISTRPDCISNDCLELLNDYNKKLKIFWLEMGLQTSNDKILKKINRGHLSEDFSIALERVGSKNIKTCAHVIIGLPEESISSCMDTARFINAQKIWGVKIHNLHIVRGTALEKEYSEGKIEVLSLDEYANLAVDFVEHLSPEIVIHRVNAHAPVRMTVAPLWSINKLGVMNAVLDEFKKRNSKQGDKCSL